MTFTERFQPFVCEGDSISCEVAGFEVIARIVRDDCPDAPDERQDGFWPSLYKDAPGFIGPGPNHRQRFAEAQAKAEAVMQAWRKDEWFYCGIVLSVTLEGVTLERNAAALFGIEANYPDSDNAYLTEVAQELLPEALDAGRAAARRFCAALETSGARA
ncbi:hypothetical protein [Hyphomonas pacifica]|uniref:Uncharacterized protein n=1 Tax=Hyphomonas pacifica TaxID=1280941 RepID=A0A062TW70_9PROT|nr:hypothetical protein [Hyphomonas pacifica]KCZ52281.1 hypothetical protein HY2_08700 [Hyphomonas pacifica]RAN34825.1 hypothetical protein HY3_10025 [Hyphomonas pacifica]